MRRSAIALTALAMGSLATPGVGDGLGDELLPNTSFEESVLEADPSLHGASPLPVRPTGWVHEGVAGAFEHVPSEGRSGGRAVAITLPRPSRVCVPEAGCEESPVNVDWLGDYYSPAPYWRTLDTVPVVVGERYRLRVWASLEGVPKGEGIATAVRWVSEDGVGNPLFPFDLARGPKLINETGADVVGWTRISKKVTVPGMGYAQVLLGYSGGTGLGRLLFDDVSFRRV